MCARLNFRERIPTGKVPSRGRLVVEVTRNCVAGRINGI